MDAHFCCLECNSGQTEAFLYDSEQMPLNEIQGVNSVDFKLIVELTGWCFEKGIIFWI